MVVDVVVAANPVHVVQNQDYLADYHSMEPEVGSFVNFGDQ